MQTPDLTPGPQAAAMRAAAAAAVRFVEPGSVIGVGTGRSSAAFIEAIAASDRRPAAAVASSQRSAELLQKAGIRVVPLWGAGLLPVYIDGADAADPELRLIKGGGGAQGGERLVADASQLFVCIVDESKLVRSLQGLSVPVEVAPNERHNAMAALAELGGLATVRAGFLTDAGNEVLDVSGLDLSDPLATEIALDDVPGMVASGIFASRPADVLIVGRTDGTVVEHHRS